jgi:hypothetical protein
VQLVLDVQDTPVRALSEPVPASRWIDHLVPFQRSTSAPAISEPKGKKNPTAVHAIADVHDTPIRWLGEPSGRKLGLGVCRTDHRRPFQRSANVPLPVPSPTAMQAALETHETPWRLPGDPAKSVQQPT